MTAGGVKEARRPVRAGAAGARGLLRAARTRRGSEGPQVTPFKGPEVEGQAAGRGWLRRELGWEINALSTIFAVI